MLQLAPPLPPPLPSHCDISENDLETSQLFSEDQDVGDLHMSEYFSKSEVEKQLTGNMAIDEERQLTENDATEEEGQLTESMFTEEEEELTENISTEEDEE